MSRILVDQIRSNSASGDAITLDGNGKCAVNATTINSLTFPSSDGSADQIIKQMVPVHYHLQQCQQVQQAQFMIHFTDKGLALVVTVI